MWDVGVPHVTVNGEDPGTGPVEDFIKGASKANAFICYTVIISISKTNDLVSPLTIEVDAVLSFVRPLLKDAVAIVDGARGKVVNNPERRVSIVFDAAVLPLGLSNIDGSILIETKRNRIKNHGMLGPRLY
jgi:hypothetical protein